MRAPLAKTRLFCKHASMLKVVNSRNCVYQTAYHVVWCPKYRKRILTGDVPGLLRASLEAVAGEILSLEIHPDHIHLFVSIPPADAVATVVKLLKGISARQLFVRCPELKQSLWGGHLWSPSYYVGTAGHVSAETIQRYIERTEHIKGRR